MTVYIDDPMNVGGRMNDWCHLWADNEAELDIFVARMGLFTDERQWINPKWKQRSQGISGEFVHYDITRNKREQALRHGATYKPLREWIAERKQWQEYLAKRGQR